jgi:2,3-bisphosphoglycerate-dependent phosphoglycerate mutase
MRTLVLLRHGESVWNREQLFTGWTDVELSSTGETEARRAGQWLGAAEVFPEVLHTSLQKRAIRTAELTLEVMDLCWLPVRRSWRLNERHYGDLQGRNKNETREKYGDEQYQKWRRGYDTPPPPLDPDDKRHARFDRQYAQLPRELIPATECLADVVDRVLPYWYDCIVPDLAAGQVVLVAAHGNSLRALVKHLDGLSAAAIEVLNIPTGFPLVYTLDDNFGPVAKTYLPDDEAAAAAAAKVAQQGQTEPT